MFTWICPKCGRDVPPSYNECPTCAANTAPAPEPTATSTPEPPFAPPPPPPIVQPPSVIQQQPRIVQQQPSVVQPPPIAVQPQAPPPPPLTAPPPSPQAYEAAPPVLPPSFGATPERSAPVARQPHTLSPSLVAGLTVVAIAALLAVLYMIVLPRDRGAAKTSTQGSSAPLATPGGPGSMQPTHPLTKYLEVSGVRISESGKDAKIRFVVTNHSAAILPPLTIELTLVAADRQVFRFPVRIPSIDPYDAKDLTATVPTTLRPYELPDWQMVRPQFRITSEP